MMIIMATRLFSRYKTLSQLRAERSSRTLANAGKDGSGNHSLSTIIYVCHIKRHPFLHGVGSLGNISGGYSRLHLYMRGNHVQDMRNDWLMVGDAFRNSLHSYRR